MGNYKRIIKNMANITKDYGSEKADKLELNSSRAS